MITSIFKFNENICLKQVNIELKYLIKHSNDLSGYLIEYFK